MVYPQVMRYLLLIVPQLGGSRSVGQVRVQTTNSHHARGRYPNRLKGLTITQVDQVWVANLISPLG
jgi:hypothetical protein